MGIQGQHPELAHHNIFFSSDYAAEFDAIFRRRRPPTEPTVYVAITSKTDAGHAPAGCENWFVLVNVPALTPDIDWTAYAADYRQVVLDRLATFGYVVRPHIQVEHTFTPEDLARQTGAWRGALYGMALHHPLAPLQRPHNRCPDVAGLYFVGGTTHPGGGVPMVMQSAKVVADMIERDT